MGGVKTKLAWAFIEMAESLDPAVLAEVVRQKTGEVVIRSVMATMDSAGVAHCAKCPQRRGITVIDGVRLCHIHKNETEAVHSGKKT